MFDEDKKIKDDMSPSQLVEICATEFSYSQLVIMASFFLQNKVDEIGHKLEKITKSRVMSLDADDLPPQIKDFLKGLAEDMDKDED